jgi:hypothetical protein
MIWQERAISRIRQMLSADTNLFTEQIRAAARLKGSESTFRRIAQTNDAGQILDYFAEIRFGLMFAHLRFVTAFEPLGTTGPDLSISRDGQKAYVEVKRFRSDNRTEEIGEPGDELQPYGNPSKDIKKILDSIVEKFKQLDCGNGIVALWGDHDDLEELEFEFAMADVRADSDAGIRQLPATLLFCVFVPAWFTVRRRQRIYIEAFRQLSEPYLTWIEDVRKL